MVLSKRERYIVFITIIIITILVVDRYALSPFLDIRAQDRVLKQQLLGEMEQAAILFQRRELMERKWQNIMAKGLQGDVSQTESSVLHAVRDWSRKGGVTLSSVKPDQVNGDGNLHEINFLVAGTGSMSSIGRFIWYAETTSLAVRVKDIQVGSRREDGEEMSLQLRFSAIYFTPENGEKLDDRQKPL